MTIERITPDMVDRAHGHTFRYQLAAGFVHSGSVLDAACGIGYGHKYLHSTDYLGVDRVIPDLDPVVARHLEQCGIRYEEHDLDVWEPPVVDHVISFETVEHLENPDLFLYWIQNAARRTIIMSVPVGVTTNVNPFHLHDFDPGELEARFTAADTQSVWAHYQTIYQPAEQAEISVWCR